MIRDRKGNLAARLGAVLFGALLLALAIAGPAAAQPSEEPFSIVPGSFHVTASTYQAGAHPDLTVSFDFAHEQTKAQRTFNDVKDTVVELPPGFIGNNTAAATCTAAQLLGNGEGQGKGPLCPPASQIGTIALTLTLAKNPQKTIFPVFNMQVSSPGIAAELGFNVVVLNQLLPVTVRPGDSGLTITSPSIEGVSEPHEISVTTWGVPAAHSHDAERGLECLVLNEENNQSTEPPCINGGKTVNIAPKSFLSNPTSCGTSTARLTADSWEHPGVALPNGSPDLSDPNWSTASTEVGPIVECERTPFDPEIEAKPTTNAAESPTGLNFSMQIPQDGWEKPETISTANLKDASVTLPAGMSLNPSAGSGLGSCSEAQLAGERFDSLPGDGCPAESKIGSVEIETPVLTEHATGSVYVATPYQNPFHSLLALYIVAKIPARGVIVKVAGEVHADPLTGQLTTTFLKNPQVPFNKFTLRFNQGATSPLVSPPACGTYTATAALTPWSAPLSPQPLSASFPVETGVRGGPCPSGGVPPFHPLLHAGSYSNGAGTYSPFYVRLSREDGEQEITHFSIKLPPGLTGKLAGIPYCSDAAIAAAKARTGPHGGQEELESPSCPKASEVGHTEVEAGVGTVLASAPGKVYLAGPYHGSNLSIVSITAAKVGPFDLGTVVVRLGFKINPETAEVFVDGVGSDPIPHIIAGIPVHLRNIRAYMDKPEFVLNPTNCQRTSTASTVLGSGLNFASEADDQPVTITSPFQVANCAALGFKPKLALSLKGGTKRGDTPAFKAVLTARPGDANIGAAQVTLPSSEYLEQAHIGTVCTRVQFNEGTVPGEKCPAASIYGRAKAVTPILSEPLEGPVYLRSSSHPLPDLVAALNNKQVNIDLDGHIDAVHKKGSEVSRIRNTFEAVPDAPVTSFTLEMLGGKKGLLTNSTDICKGTHRVLADLTGQNGKLYDTNPVLSAQCGGKGKKKGAKRHD